METNINYSKTKIMIQAIFCFGLIVYGIFKVRPQGLVDSIIISIVTISIIYLIYDLLKKFFTSEPIIKLSSCGIENNEFGLIQWSEIEYIRYSPRYLILKMKSKEQETIFQIITDLNISNHTLKQEISKHYHLEEWKK